MLNYDKTYFLQFHTKANNGNNTQILNGNKTIETVKSIQFLGVNLDTTLNWKHHISELMSKLNKADISIIICCSAFSKSVLLLFVTITFVSSANITEVAILFNPIGRSLL